MKPSFPKLYFSRYGLTIGINAIAIVWTVETGLSVTLFTILGISLLAFHFYLFSIINKNKGYKQLIENRWRGNFGYYMYLYLTPLLLIFSIIINAKLRWWKIDLITPCGFLIIYDYIIGKFADYADRTLSK